MSKHKWSDILQAQRDSGLSIEAFCRVNSLARSNFYTARARAKSQFRRLSQSSKQRRRVCCPEIPINSVQRSDSSRYSYPQFRMGIGVGLLALPGLLGAFPPHGFAF